MDHITELNQNYWVCSEFDEEHSICLRNYVATKCKMAAHKYYLLSCLPNLIPVEAIHTRQIAWLRSGSSLLCFYGIECTIEAMNL